jgi:hypothetical protein
VPKLTNQTQQRLFLIWLIISVGVFVLMLTHQSTPMVVLGRYSLNYSALLVSVILVVLASGVTYVQIRRGRLDINRLSIDSSQWLLAWLVMIAMLITLFWAFAPITTIAHATNLFRIFIVATLIFVGSIPLLNTHSAPPRSLLILWITLAGLCAVLSISWLGQVPPPLHYDEPDLANMAVTWAQTGVSNRMTLIGEQSFPDTYWGLYPLGIGLQLLGITQVNARILVALIALCCLPFVYATLQRLYGKGIARAGVLLGIVMVVQQSYVRMDVFAPLCLAVGLWGHVYGEKRFVWHFFAGFFLAMSIEGHQLALVYPIALGIYTTLEYGLVWHKTRTWRYVPFWGLLLGAIVYGLVYILTRATLNGQDIVGFVRTIATSYDEQALTGNTLSQPFFVRVNLVFGELIGTFLNEYPLTLCLGVVALLLSRRDLLVRKWTFVFWVGLGISVCINPKASYQYYIIHTLPLVLLMGGGILNTLVAHRYYWLSMALVGWCVVWIWAGFARLLPSDAIEEVIDIGYQIETVLPRDTAPIVGRSVYYWGLHDFRYYVAPRFIPGEQSPQVVIFTQGLDDDNPYYLDAIQTANLQLAGCYPAPTSGWRVLLYTTPDIAQTLPEKGC